MNDYAFGNHICELRKEAKLSQTELANMIGVTNKAVSKWENGCAKPTTDMLKKLSKIFNESLEDLLEKREERPMKNISKIVITGGPCAGKTTAMSWIQNNITKLGYTVLFVPETATELITGGVAPWTCGSVLDYQSLQVRLQMEKEDVFEKAAETMHADKILIVCDRGLMDNKAYMTDAEFKAVLKQNNSSEVSFRDRYDAVFHLVTSAKGAEEYYTCANNSARTEGIDEARALDDRLMNAWTGHPHLRIIDNSSDFNEKMFRLIREINAFLGEPVPYEIERKFLIEYPDLKALEAIPNCERVDIIQTYLTATSENEEVRVRQRGCNGNYVYYKTTKRTITGMKRIELEEKLSERQYLSLLMEADTSKRQIKKTRYCLTYGNRYFEIDIYPEWKDKAILEIELSDENDNFEIPEMFKVIREVTDEKAYKNSELAKI